MTSHQPLPSHWAPVAAPRVHSQTPSYLALYFGGYAFDYGPWCCRLVRVLVCVPQAELFMLGTFTLLAGGIVLVFWALHFPPFFASRGLQKLLKLFHSFHPEGGPTWHTPPLRGKNGRLLGALLFSVPCAPPLAACCGLWLGRAHRAGYDPHPTIYLRCTIVCLVVFRR